MEIEIKRPSDKQTTTTKNCFELFTFRAVKLVDVVTVEQVDPIKDEQNHRRTIITTAICM